MRAAYRQAAPQDELHTTLPRRPCFRLFGILFLDTPDVLGPEEFNIACVIKTHHKLGRSSHHQHIQGFWSQISLLASNKVFHRSSQDSILESGNLNRDRKVSSCRNLIRTESNPRDQHLLSDLHPMRLLCHHSGTRSRPFLSCVTSCRY